MKIPESVITIFFSKWSCSKKVNTILTLQQRLNHNTFQRRPRDKIQSTKMYYYCQDIYDAFPFFWFKHDKVLAQNALYQNSFCSIRMYINETSLNDYFWDISEYDFSYSITQNFSITRLLDFIWICLHDKINLINLVAQ